MKIGTVPHRGGEPPPAAFSCEPLTSERGRAQPAPARTTFTTRRTMMRRAILLAAVLAAASAAPGQVREVGAPAGDDAEAAIAANHSQFVGAFGKRDAAAVAALHAADARLLPEGGRPVEGAEAVEAFWRGLLEAGARLVQLQTLRVEAHGAMAYEAGDYIMTVPSSPGQTVVHAGSYVVVWRREGGGWKVAAAIWNSDRAAPGQ